MAASAIGGAALAALAVYAIERMNTPEAAPTAAFEQRIAEIERSVSAGARQPQVAPAALAALEKRVASVEALASGASEAARRAVEAAARPAAAPGAPQSAGADAPAAAEALQAIEARIATLEKNAASAPDGALETRLAAVEKTLAAPKAEDRATETRVEPAPPPDLEPMRKQIAALEARLQEIEKQAAPLADAARANEARIREVDERIQPLASRIDESRAQGDAERKRVEAIAERSADAARVSLAQSLVTALQTGAPFATQIEGLAGLAAPAGQLAPLKDAARTGVATEAELARTLAALEAKIVARPEAPADASVVDRLTSSALGLVRVRPAGEPKGDSPADVFARMMQATQRGDVAGALKERERLPDQGKAASADWAKRAQQRIEAEQAAHALLSGSIQKLGRS